MARGFLALLLILSFTACDRWGPSLSEDEASRAIRDKDVALVPPERPFAEVRHFKVTAVARVDATHYHVEYQYADVPKDQPLREAYVLERYAVTIERIGDRWVAQPATREARGQERRAGREGA